MIEREERRAVALQAAAIIMAAIVPHAPALQEDYMITRHVLDVAQAFDAYLSGDIMPDGSFINLVVNA